MPDDAELARAFWLWNQSLSACCEALLKVATDGSRWYVCSKCGERQLSGSSPPEVMLRGRDAMLEPKADGTEWTIDEVATMLAEGQREAEQMEAEEKAQIEKLEKLEKAWRAPAKKTAAKARAKSKTPARPKPSGRS